MTVIDEIMEQTVESETPRAFIYWAIVAAISAIVGKQVWFDKHYYKLFPNVYIMLFAKSGMRKGFPIGIARDIVRHVNNTRIISGQNSIQAVITSMSKATTQKDGPMLTDARAFLLSQELATFLIEDPSATTILTDLYDTHANVEWKKVTKSSGTETLKNVCLTMLSATNADLFREAVPSHGFAGGFMARTLVINAEKRHKKNDLLDAPLIKFNLESVMPYFHDISKVSGPFSLSPIAKDMFRDWYAKHEPELKDDKTGTADRIHDQILKVAMLLSLSKKLDLIVEESDMDESMEACLAFTTNVNRITAGSGKSPFAAQTQKVMEALLSAPDYQLSKVKLLQKHYGDFDAFDLSRIIDTLSQAEAIEIKTTSKGPVYVLPQKIVDQYLTIQKSRKGQT